MYHTKFVILVTKDDLRKNDPEKLWVFPVVLVHLQEIQGQVKTLLGLKLQRVENIQKSFRNFSVCFLSYVGYTGKFPKLFCIFRKEEGKTRGGQQEKKEFMVLFSHFQKQSETRKFIWEFYYWKQVHLALDRMIFRVKNG